MRRFKVDGNTGSMSAASMFTRLGVLFGLFLLMMIALTFIVGFIPVLNLNPRTAGLLLATLQGIFVFILPAVLYGRVFSFSPFKSLGLSQSPSGLQILGVILVFIIALPMLNQLIFWNEAVILPDFLSGLEKTLKEMEKQAVESTEILLSTKSFGGMLMGVLIIGVLTGLAEEIFFRGALQRAFINSNIGPHKAIWITAFIFSAMHFQFYGFIPRLLLGAFFGYVFWWSGSLWVSIFAHALNNSLVVITTWLEKSDITSFDIEQFGISSDSFPWIPLVSFALVVIFFSFFKSLFYDRTHPYKLK